MSFFLKNDDSKLEELYQLALQRRDESPLIGELAILDQATASNLFPGLEGFERFTLCFWWSSSRWATPSDSLLGASQVKVIIRVSLTLYHRAIR